MGNPLEVQWLGLHTLTAEGQGSIPGRGTKIPQAVWCGQNQKQTNKQKLMNQFRMKVSHAQLSR